MYNEDTFDQHDQLRLMSVFFFMWHFLRDFRWEFVSFHFLMWDTFKVLTGKPAWWQMEQKNTQPLKNLKVWRKSYPQTFPALGLILLQEITLLLWCKKGCLEHLFFLSFPWSWPLYALALIVHALTLFAVRLYIGFSIEPVARFPWRWDTTVYQGKRLPNEYHHETFPGDNITSDKHFGDTHFLKCCVWMTNYLIKNALTCICFQNRNLNAGSNQVIKFLFHFVDTLE